MLANDRDGLIGGIDALGNSHILGLGQLEAGLQHLLTGPFNQTVPHRTHENQGNIVQMPDLQQLPDHGRFQQRADTTGRHDVSIGHHHELMQTGEEGLMQKSLLDKGIAFLFGSQTQNS